MFIRFQFNLTLDLSGSTLTLQPLTTSSRTRRSRQKLSWVSLEAQLDSSGLSGDIGRFRENTQLGAQASTNHQRAVESRCVRDGRESRDRMVLPDKYFFFKLLFNYYLKFSSDLLKVMAPPPDANFRPIFFSLWIHASAIFLESTRGGLQILLCGFCP